MNKLLFAAMIVLAYVLAPYLLIIFLAVILISYAIYKSESRAAQKESDNACDDAPTDAPELSATYINAEGDFEWYGYSETK